LAQRDLVFLTGGTGFVGSHVATALLEAGYRVRAIARDPSQLPPEVERIAGDMREAGTFARTIDGSRFLVHCAALYSLARRDRRTISRVNVEGTATLLAAAHVAGVERAVVTSSSAAVGHERDGIPADETAWAQLGAGAYHDSKVFQERVAFASRVPLVSILPTAPVGPGDRNPTPTGKLVLDFARGAIFGKPPGRGGMNLVAVEDVARAHVAALTRGRTGERYIVGGENHTFDDVWEMLATATGRSVPRMRVPSAIAFGVAYADAARCAVWAHAQPFAPLEGLRMARERMFVDTGKSIAELGHRPSSVAEALSRAVTWFRANGYV
jgi:dihydroflavonol-4-reductase